jgi:hypothetical protein
MVFIGVIVDTAGIYSHIRDMYDEKCRQYLTKNEIDNKNHFFDQSILTYL